MLLAVINFNTSRNHPVYSAITHISNACSYLNIFFLVESERMALLRDVRCIAYRNVLLVMAHLAFIIGVKSRLPHTIQALIALGRIGKLFLQG